MIQIQEGDALREKVKKKVKNCEARVFEKLVPYLYLLRLVLAAIFLR